MLKPLEQPRQKFASLADVFESALEQEQEVSRQIDSLYEIAFKEKAFAAVAELQWFLTEQVEEEKTGREIVAKFKLIGNDPASILDMDRELGTPLGGVGEPTAQRMRATTDVRRPGLALADERRSAPASCSPRAPQPPATSGPSDPRAPRRRPRFPSPMLPKIDAAAILERIKVLSVGQFEGRAPGTTGEELTVEYLTAQFKKLGLKPGNPTAPTSRRCRSSASPAPKRSR